MIRNLFGGTSKCRTIDKVDIFGDSSGVALYQLDGNANDTGGNYHGTEVAGVTYGGGAYERGVIVTSGKIDLGAGSKALMPSTSDYSISAWIYNSGTASRRIIAARMNSSTGSGQSDYLMYESDNTLVFGKVFGSTGGNMETLVYTPSYSIGWHHVVMSFARGTNIVNLYSDGVLVATKSNWNTGTYDNNLNTLMGAFHNTNYNAYQDQVRFFNRAITATEVATLYAECAPTSIVDNINPFMDGSLKALYKFDGDATDATGVYNGTATDVTYGTGKFGSAAVFNGTALISTSFALSANVFSYSIWANVTTVSSTIQSLIDFTTNRAMLSSGNGTNSYMSYYDGGTYRTFGAYSLPSNTRVFLTLVVNGTTAYLYADGVLKGSSACTAVIPSGGMYLGRYAGSASGFLTGNLDQARIFNKALTPLEVASLYNETTPLEEPMYKLVDPFKDGSGKALYRLEGNALDESGNYNGTATSVTYEATSVGRQAVFNGSASISVAMALSANTFSYSLWATVTTVSATIQSLIDFSTGRAMLSSGNGTNSYLSYYDGTAYRVFGTYALTSATKTHIGLAVNGTSVELFINGVSQGTSACSAVTPSGNLYLGMYAGSAAGYLTGREDQTRIFTRVLTASEFQQLYTQGA